MPEPEAVREEPSGRPATAARPGVEPPAREVPDPDRPLRAGGQDPQGGSRATRLAHRDGLGAAVEGEGDAGEAAVSAWRVALGGSLAVLLAQDAASASVPPKLIGSTAQAASLFAAGRAVTAGVVSAEVAALTREVLKTMLLTKLKITTAVLLLGFALAASGTGLAYRAHATEERSGGVTQADQAGPQQVQAPKTQASSMSDAEKPKAALPGASQSYFGGGPGQPSYIRNNNLFFVTSPVGDKFSIYDAVTKKAVTLRLPTSKESPLKVVPIRSNGPLIALMLEGPKITRLYVFSIKDWKWYNQDLKEPAAGNVYPSVGHSVASYTQGRYIYAFSAEAKRWGILELPEGVPARLSQRGQEKVSRYMDSIVVEYDGHVHEFGGNTGEWKHTDLRAVIDAAIDSAKDEAK